jgi:gamma-glutamyltranspeptidase/glutathione hydrolase
VPGVVVTRGDLERYEARWVEPVEAAYAGTRVLTRGGLSGVPELLARLPRLRGLSATERVLALVDALDDRGSEGHTTNLCTADAEGQAVVLTSSLGLGSGDFLPGLDLHLNSMLGEQDLLVGPLEPGGRMQSMMAPSVAVDLDGVALAIGSAGGTRLRTALCTVAAGVLDEGLAPQEAVDRPRVHPAGSTVNAEPGVDEAALVELEASGRAVRRWPDLHHYFGGTSLISRHGAAADPRRDGLALEL